MCICIFSFFVVSNNDRIKLTVVLVVSGIYRLVCLFLISYECNNKMSKSINDNYWCFIINLLGQNDLL